MKECLSEQFTAEWFVSEKFQGSFRQGGKSDV